MDTENEMKKKASAWYMVTYMHNNEDSESKDFLLSFPGSSMICYVKLSKETKCKKIKTQI